MKKIWILSVLCALLLVGCHSVQRHYTKGANGITISETDSDGSTTTKTYADPSIKFLKNQGLEEHEAIDLVSKGVPASSSSRELTTAGLVIVIIIIILVIAISIASGDGFTAGWIIGDMLDDD